MKFSALEEPLTSKNSTNSGIILKKRIPWAHSCITCSSARFKTTPHKSDGATAPSDFFIGPSKSAEAIVEVLPEPLPEDGSALDPLCWYRGYCIPFGGIIRIDCARTNTGMRKWRRDWVSPVFAGGCLPVACFFQRKARRKRTPSAFLSRGSSKSHGKANPELDILRRLLYNEEMNQRFLPPPVAGGKAGGTRYEGK